MVHESMKKKYPNKRVHEKGMDASVIKQEKGGVESILLNKNKEAVETLNKNIQSIKKVE